VIGRLARAGATVAIAGALVFAVPISAQAGLLDPLTLAPYAIGAVRAAAPVEAAAGVIGPEGTLLVTTAVVLGALAYATKDTWMPWVSGLLGAGGSTTVNPAGVSINTIGSWAIVGPGLQAFTASFIGTTYRAGDLYRTWQCVSASGVTTSGSGVTAVNLTANVANLYTVGPCVAGSTITAATAQIKHDYSTADSNLISWGQSFDPHTQATYTVVADCVKPDGTTGTASVTTKDPGIGGWIVPSCVEVFGPGSHASEFSVSGGADGTTPKPLSTYPLPTDAQTAVLYPNCVGAGAIACTYIVDYQGVACTVGQAECVNWTLRQLAHPADYTCFYGPYALPSTDSCAIDERVYEPNGVRLTMKNTDGDPWTYDSPAPAGMPELQPQPGTGTGTVPETGTGTIPGGTTGVLPSPGSAPSSNGDCWSGGAFSWNPVDWVLTPVQCALSWAFVPSQAQVSGPIADFKTTWNSKPPGSLIVGATSVFSSIGTGWNGGCSGSASASFSRPEDGHPLQLPCTPSGGGSGSVPYTAMQIALIVATLVYLWHMVAAGISAQATGSGGD